MFKSRLFLVFIFPLLVLSCTVEPYPRDQITVEVEGISDLEMAGMLARRFRRAEAFEGRGARHPVHGGVEMGISSVRGKGYSIQLFLESGLSTASDIQEVVSLVETWERSPNFPANGPEVRISRIVWEKEIE